MWVGDERQYQNRVGRSHVQPVDRLHQSRAGLRSLLRRSRLRQAAAFCVVGRRTAAQAHRTQHLGTALRWNADAARIGVRYRVFCASLADVFDNEVPEQWRDDLFTLIERTPNIDWLLVTKRIGNVGKMLPVPFDFDRLYPNVWIGATITSQSEADRDIPKLLALSAARRFLSIEPLLGPVTLRELHGDMCEIDALTGDHGVLRPLLGRSDAKVHWVIVGGESGPNARPMHPDWARSLREQCAAAGVPFLFKQWGEWSPANGIEYIGPRSDLYVCDWGEMARIGKKAAGRLLDGVEHNGFPSSAVTP